MRRNRTLAVAVMVSTWVGIALVAPREAVALPADETVQEVWSCVERGMNSFTTMDRAAFEANITDDIVAFDIDLQGKPVRMASLADAMSYFDAMSAETKKLGGTVAVTVRSHECRATAELGFCAVEMDFVVKMPDGAAISQPSFVSAVVKKTPSGWKWIHWHTSLSVVPAPAAP